MAADVRKSWETKTTRKPLHTMLWHLALFTQRPYHGHGELQGFPTSGQRELGARVNFPAKYGTTKV